MVRFRELTRKQALKGIGIITKVKSTTNKEFSEASDCCAICIQNFKLNESIRNLQCKHLFHAKCIDKWLYMQFCADEELLCPLCQQDIFASF